MKCAQIIYSDALKRDRQCMNSAVIDGKCRYHSKGTVPKAKVQIEDNAPVTQSLVHAVQAYLRGTSQSEDMSLRGRLVNALGEFEVEVFGEEQV